MMNFLGFLLIGVIAGWLAGKLVRGKGYGLLINMIVGVIGAFIGGGIFNYFGIFGAGFIIELSAAVIGAIVLIAFVRIVKKL
jgi:uncharacterized membrane protein YeaQ/YmgE (transglycosylase-associated protein family)